MIDYANIIACVTELITYAFPISLIFGVCGKLCNIAFDFILNRKIEM